VVSGNLLKTDSPSRCTRQQDLERSPRRRVVASARLRERIAESEVASVLLHHDPSVIRSIGPIFGIQMLSTVLVNITDANSPDWQQQLCMDEHAPSPTDGAALIATAAPMSIHEYCVMQPRLRYELGGWRRGFMHVIDGHNIPGSLPTGKLMVELVRIKVPAILKGRNVHSGDCSSRICRCFKHSLSLRKRACVRVGIERRRWL
jgi:hypothetical protein